MIRATAIGIGAALCLASHGQRADGLRGSNRRSVDIELRSAFESRERKQGPGES